MRSTTRRSVLLATALTAVFLTALIAPASSPAVIVGIGDQKSEVFQDPNFKRLGVKRTRLFTPYDSIFLEPAALDTWIRDAQRNGLEPVISFEKPRNMTCPGSGCRPVSPAAYERAFRAFRAKYPTIRNINPWNEGNSGTQPTGRNPRANAQYYNIVRRNCSGCRIIAADVLDISNMERWLTTFQRYADGSRRKTWGLHNYGDTNRFRTTGTRTLLRVTQGPIWILETGGIVTFRTADGRTALATSEARAARSLRYLLTRLVAIDRRRIERVYLYNWKPLVSGNDRFDAGLVRPDNSPRASYTTVLGFRSLFR